MTSQVLKKKTNYLTTKNTQITILQSQPVKVKIGLKEGNLYKLLLFLHAHKKRFPVLPNTFAPASVSKGLVT